MRGGRSTIQDYRFRRRRENARESSADYAFDGKGGKEGGRGKEDLIGRVDCNFLSPFRPPSLGRKGK